MLSVNSVFSRFLHCFMFSIIIVFIVGVVIVVIIINYCFLLLQVY